MKLHQGSKYNRNFLISATIALLLSSVAGILHWRSLQVDYSKLNGFLSHHQWMEADRETSYLVGAILRREIDDKTFFGYSRLDFFLLGVQKNRFLNSTGLPCKDMQRIDQIWSMYSEGAFGFTAQSQIAIPMETAFRDKGVGRDKAIKEFESRLGWREDNGHSSPRNLEWYKRAETSMKLKGFLPSKLWVGENAPEAPRHELIDTLSHFRSCSIP
jgi:hypothetical protein